MTRKAARVTGDESLRQLSLDMLSVLSLPAAGIAAAYGALRPVLAGASWWVPLLGAVTAIYLVSVFLGIRARRIETSAAYPLVVGGVLLLVILVASDDSSEVGRRLPYLAAIIIVWSFLLTSLSWLLVVLSVVLVIGLGLVWSSAVGGVRWEMSFELAAAAAFAIAASRIAAAYARDKAELARREAGYRERLEDAVADTNRELEQRLRVEDALRSERDFAESLIEHAPAIVLILDADGHILGMNPHAESVLEIRLAEARGISMISEFVQDADTARVHEVLRRAREETSIEGGTIAARTGGGQRRNIEIFARSLIEEGVPVGFLVIGQDVTERERLQLQLAEAERLASLGTLSAGVGHEINNPLAYVLTNTEYVAEVLGEAVESARALVARLEQDSSSDPRVRSSLLSARKLVRQGEDVLCAASDTVDGARRIRDIVSQLRAFSRQRDERRERLQVREVIENALSLVHNEITCRAKLVTHFGRVADVVADESRLARALVNLLLNAAHAMDEGAAEVKEVRVDVGMDGSEVCVSICDRSPTIPDESVHRVFEPFHLENETTTSLRLSLAYNIIASFGGRIEVKKGPEEGNCLVVRLPSASQ